MFLLYSHFLLNILERMTTFHYILNEKGLFIKVTVGAGETIRNRLQIIKSSPLK